MTKKIAKNDQNVLGKSYQALLSEIKEKVKTSQIKAVLAVNQELISLYWEVGTSVHRKQQEEGWGRKND